MNLTTLLKRHTRQVEDGRWLNPLPTAGDFHATDNEWTLTTARKDGHGGAEKIAGGNVVDLFIQLHGPAETLLCADFFGGEAAVLARMKEVQKQEALQGRRTAELLSEAVNICSQARSDRTEVVNMYSLRGISPAVQDNEQLGWCERGALVPKLKAAGFTEAEITNAGVGSILRSGQCGEKFCHRLVFPIKTEYGHVVGLNARRAFDEAEQLKYDFAGKQKYLISSGCRKELHPGCFEAALDAAQSLRSIVLCEGMFDTLSTRQAGLNAIALNGSAAATQVLQRIGRLGYHAGIALDMDLPGRKATAMTVETCWRSGFSPHVCSIPAPAKDLNEYFYAGGTSKGLKWEKGAAWMALNMEHVGRQWEQILHVLPSQGELFRFVTAYGKARGFSAQECASLASGATLDALHTRPLTLVGPGEL